MNVTLVIFAVPVDCLAARRQLSAAALGVSKPPSSSCPDVAHLEDLQGRTRFGDELFEKRGLPPSLDGEPCGPRRKASVSESRPHDSYLVDPASSHMLVSKTKPCMSKYKRFYTVKLRMAH